MKVRTRNDELDLVFYQHFEDRDRGWSASYKCQWEEGEPYSDGIGVVFAGKSMYEIEEGLQNKGLGSYILRELLLWAKQNYGDAIADIAPFNQGDNNQQILDRFYGKFNLDLGVKIKDTITDLDTIKKVEVISCENFILNLSKNLSQTQDLLSDYKKKNATLEEKNSKFLNREKDYWKIIGVLFVILILILKVRLN